MTWGELSNFTWGELSNFTWGQLSKDKLELLNSISKGELDVPEDVADKIYTLCLETIQSYEKATGKKCDIPQPKPTMSIKDKLTCINLLLSIWDKLPKDLDYKNLWDTFVKALNSICELLN